MLYPLTSLVASGRGRGWRREKRTEIKKKKKIDIKLSATPACLPPMCVWGRV
jgi:hypothetical protein